MKHLRHNLTGVLGLALVLGLLVIVIIQVAIQRSPVRQGSHSKGLSPQAQSRVDQISSLMNDVRVAREDGDAAVEETKLRAVLSLSPAVIGARLQLAELLDKQHRAQEALQEYAMIVHPGEHSFSTLQLDPRVLCRYAELSALEGNDEEAVQAARKAISVDSPTLGNHLPSLDQEPRTSADLWANTYVATSFAHYRLGDLELAIQSIDKAIAKAPSNGVAHFYRGFYLEEAKRNAEAKIEFEEAKRLAPGNDLLVTEANRKLKRIGYVDDLKSRPRSSGTGTSDNEHR